MGKIFHHNWFRFIAFLGITLSIFWLIQTFFFTNDVAWARKQFYAKLDNEYKVIFVGNSLSFTSFSPGIIADITGVDSYSLGTSEQLIDQSYYELKQLIRYQIPELIILEANAFIPDVKDQQSLAEFESSNEISSWFQTVVKRKLPLIDNHSAWKLPAELFKNFNDLIHYLTTGKSTGVDNFGFYPLPDISANQAQMSDLDKKIINIDHISEVNEKFLDEYRYLCDETGIDLAVIKSPILFASEYNLLFNQKAAKPFTYYDLNTISMDMNWLHYQDPSHLSTFGSIIASVDAAKFISKTLKQSLNQSALDYYSSYFFDNLVIDKVEDYYTFSLIPSDPEASSSLVYKWEVMNEDVKLVEKGYVKDNNISFPSGLPGDEYSIHVWINNPAGDYVLEGIFSYIFN